MVSIISAFQFLTIFPTVIRRTFTAQEMGRAVGWFPLVGLVLGAAMLGLHSLAELVFPASVSAALTVCAWVALIRAFHLDGFMDTCDGLFGGFTPERRLEIMKDSRMGAVGAKSSTAAANLKLYLRMVFGGLNTPKTIPCVKPLPGCPGGNEPENR